MRKILIISGSLLLTISCFFALVQKTNAKENPGTFRCKWQLINETTENCVINDWSVTCSQGYVPHPDFCLQIGNMNECNNAVFDCVPYGTPLPFSPRPAPPFGPCENITDSDMKKSCRQCFGEPDAPTGDSWTAIGCITTSDPQAFVTWLLARAIGIAGGIAFLLMIFAGFQIITSSGDPEKLKSGKEMLTSAIIGLIVIIFSIFLLKIIGYDILRLPKFELLSPTS